MSESATRTTRGVRVIPTLLPRLEMNLWCQDEEIKEGKKFGICLALHYIRSCTKSRCLIMTLEVIFSHYLKVPEIQ